MPQSKSESKSIEVRKVKAQKTKVGGNKRKAGKKQAKIGLAFILKKIIRLYLFGSWVAGPPQRIKQPRIFWHTTVGLKFT